MIKYIVAISLLGVLLTVAVIKEYEAFNKCLINTSKDTCLTEMAGG